MTGTATLIEETAMTPFKAFAVLTLAAVILAPGNALASSIIGYVTAESRFGNGVVRAPVREAQFGRQVKLPGGTWLYCKISGFLPSNRRAPCSETLRRETVDFWETYTK